MSRSLTTLLILLVVVSLGVGGWFVWPYFPGTLYRDSQGRAHGTGSIDYSYKDGSLKLREWYRAGKLLRSVWYRPDGATIQETIWRDESGEGIYVREDGSIKIRMNYVHGIAEGTATYYREDGSIERTEEHGRDQREALP